MVASSLGHLVEVFAEVYGSPQGQGYSPSLLGYCFIIFLGLLSRITEMALLVLRATLRSSRKNRLRSSPEGRFKAVAIFFTLCYTVEVFGGTVVYCVVSATEYTRVRSNIASAD